MKLSQTETIYNLMVCIGALDVEVPGSIPHVTNLGNEVS